MSTATEQRAPVGRTPSSPERLSRGDWLAALKRASKQFLRDDCTGLAQQIAYSSLLAFFPAVAFLVGALGLFNLFDDLERLLDLIAPNGVIDFISSLQQDSGGGTSAVAFGIGLVAAVWVASGAMRSVIRRSTAPTRCKRRGRSGLTAWSRSLLVIITGLTTAGVFLLIVVGGDLEAQSREAHLGDAFDWTWAILRWPVAFCAILLFFALVYYPHPTRSSPAGSG